VICNDLMLPENKLSSALTTFRFTVNNAIYFTSVGDNKTPVIILRD